MPSAIDPAIRIERRTLRTRDGVALSYEVLGEGARTIVLANGLGGRLYSWKPLIEALHREYTFLTWDYRGLFDSPCDTVNRLSVRDHSEDVLAILAAENVEKAVWVGWSMGVQVSLEAAVIAPHRFAGMVLLNGTYGHVFSSGFQPWFRLPIVPRYLHEITEVVRARPAVSKVLATLSEKSTLLTLGLFWLLMGPRARELHPMLRQYTEDIYRPENFSNYLRLFQELDSHSVYHHLPRVRLPALVVSGAFDVLTPSYQSRAIARRLRGAEHLEVRNASHFVLLERPEQVLPPIQRFLRDRASW